MLPVQKKLIRCISHTKIVKCGLLFVTFGVTEYMWCALQKLFN
jgi:hypothetical protein